MSIMSLLDEYETELFDRYNNESISQNEFEADMYDTLEPEEPESEVLTCSDCPDDLCTGHCLSCPYGAQ